MSEPPGSPFRADLLAGQVAFVTGGATGIGKEICRVLGRHGARIVMASRKQEDWRPPAPSSPPRGSRPRFDTCDVREPEQVEAGRSHGVIDAYGRLDIVVNNAAGNFPARIAEI